MSKYVHQQECALIVITNQASIVSGYYTEQQLHQLADWMCEQFLAVGAPIDRVYFYPYHSNDGLCKYLKDELSRKPHLGMIRQTQKDLSIDLSRSVLIGEKLSDIHAGMGINLLFAKERPNELDDLSYVPIAAHREAINFLQRGAQ